MQVVHHEPDEHLLAFKNKRERNMSFRSSGHTELEHPLVHLDELQKAHVLPVILDEQGPIGAPGLVTVLQRLLVLTGNLAANVVKLVGRFFGECILAIEGEEIDNFRSGNHQAVFALVPPCLLELGRKARHKVERDAELLRAVHHVGGIVREVPTGKNGDFITTNLGKQPAQEVRLVRAEDIDSIFLCHLVLEGLVDVLSDTVCDVIISRRKINRYTVNRVFGTVGYRESSGSGHLNIKEADIDFLHVRLEHPGLRVVLLEEPGTGVDVDFGQMVLWATRIVVYLSLGCSMPLDGIHFPSIDILHPARNCAEFSPIRGIECVDDASLLHRSVIVPQEQVISIPVMIDGRPHSSLSGLVRRACHSSFHRFLLKYSKKATKNGGL